MARPARAAIVAAQPHAWGDVILARKDMPTSYHLSVVVDDAFAGRDRMWCAGRTCSGPPVCTGFYRIWLGLFAPAYRHHRLMLGADGRKLSKSTHATALARFGPTERAPADIRKMVGLAAGVNGRRRGACHNPIEIMGREPPERTKAKRARTAPRKAARAGGGRRQIENALAALAHDIRTPLSRRAGLVRTAHNIRFA